MQFLKEEGIEFKNMQLKTDNLLDLGGKGKRKNVFVNKLNLKNKFK